jgi:DNA-binding FadR family transcriptional regulator
MTRTKPRPRQTFQAELTDRIGQEICAGRMMPGQVVPSEPILCERFGVSRIVVREAVKALAAKGMLEVRRKTGTVVQPRERWHLFDPDVIGWYAASASIDRHFVSELLELRRAVEPAVAHLAARRATEEDRRAIRLAFEEMARAAPGLHGYVPADLAFHAAVLTASHNRFFWQMQSALAVLLRTSFTISVRVPRGPVKSLSLHEDLCRGIEVGDPPSAERAALALIERAESDLAAVVAEAPSDLPLATAE